MKKVYIFSLSQDWGRAAKKSQSSNVIKISEFNTKFQSIPSNFQFLHSLESQLSLKSFYSQKTDNMTEVHTIKKSAYAHPPLQLKTHYV